MGKVTPQLCLQVMSPAVPIYHPWRFSYTLMWKESRPIVISTTPTALLSFANEAPAPARTNCQKKFIAFPSNDLSEMGEEKLALRRLSRKDSQHIPNAFPTFAGSFGPKCPFPEFHCSQKAIFSLETISFGGTFSLSFKLSDKGRVT